MDCGCCLLIIGVASGLFFTAIGIISLIVGGVNELGIFSIIFGVLILIVTFGSLAIATAMDSQRRKEIWDRQFHRD